jgi:hypothetical protein
LFGTGKGGERPRRAARLLGRDGRAVQTRPGRLAARQDLASPDPAKEVTHMRLMSANRFERFFRIEAGLNVDKSDLKRHNEFVNHKISDLLIRAEAAAKANDRDIIRPFDLPITKGLQERIHEFRLLDEDIELQPVLDDVVALPPLDLACAEDTEARLPEIAGGLSLALARTFKIIDPDVENPQSEHWERSFRIFDQLL